MKIACLARRVPRRALAHATAVTAIMAVSAIALPATWAASTKSKQRSHHNAILVAGPLHVRAYKMYLIASPPKPHNKANLLVIFERGNDNDYQTHYYGFSHRVSVEVGADGRSAKIDANLKPFGHVHLTFAPGDGRLPAAGDLRRRHDRPAGRHAQPRTQRLRSRDAFSLLP